MGVSKVVLAGLCEGFHCIGILAFVLTTIIMFFLAAGTAMYGTSNMQNLLICFSLQWEEGHVLFSS